MPPKAKAKGKAKAVAKSTPSEPSPSASPSKRKAEDAPGSTSPAKLQKTGSGSKFEGVMSAAKSVASAALEAIKRSTSTEALQKAKNKASSGASGSGGGARAVDNRVPKAGLKVYEDYSVKLNQTHIDANNNKFYIIQVLEGDGKYYAWNRWGRVGEDGQNKLQPCGNADQAIKEFKKKFRDKTQNNWDDGFSNFKPVNGKYTLVLTQESGDGGGQDSAPMGRLTEVQIGKGQVVLDGIEAELQKSSPQKQKLEVLSSQFYSLIPHNFGRQRPTAILDQETLLAKVELLKFYLRMGFDEVEEDTGATPISGVMQLPLPKTLEEAAGGICGKGDVKASTNKGDVLAKKQAGKPMKKMDTPLYAAIMLYTGNAIYRDLNQCLRDENRAKIKKYFKYLRLFIEAMQCLPKQKRTLWRGLSVDLFDNPQYEVGKTITWWGVSSTTSDINVAQNFAKGCGGKCTILTVESMTASDISELSFYSNEKESLLMPGTQLQVKSKKKNGNVSEITLKEVGNALA